MEEDKELSADEAIQDALGEETLKESDPNRQDEIDHAKLLEQLAIIGQQRTRSMFHTATPQHSAKMRGVGITRKIRSSTKKADKLASKRRRSNRKHNSHSRG